MKRLRVSRRMAVLTIVILGAFGGAASAYFTATGAGTATARVGTLNPPVTVSATATPGSATVPITWNAPSTGISPQGYYVVRDTSGAEPAPACGTSATSLSTSTSCKDRRVPDGNYTYTVVAKYHSFSANADSNAVTVVADNAAPRVTLTSPAHGSVTATPTISGAAGNAAGDWSDVTVTIYDGAGTAGTVRQTLTVTRSDASWSTSATLAQGTYTVRATQTDTAGNIGTSAANTFTVDTSAPTVTLTSPADGSVVATTKPTIGGAAGDATGDSSKVTVTIYDGAGTAGAVRQTLNVTRSGASWSTSAKKLAQGTYTVRATQTDTAGNVGTSAANTFTVDTSAPALRMLEMVDSDANGKVDEVKATFDETLATSTATEPWTLTNVPSGETLSAVSTSGSAATLTINEGSGAADTSVGSFKVALAANPNAIRDAAGNQASLAATAPSDLAAPTLSALQMLDSDANGKVDELKATFSETLATSTATEPWTLTDVPSGETLSAVSTSGSSATLTINEGGGAADTSVGSFKVALAANPNAIRDATGNQASFDATPPSDLAGPVLMTATSDGGTTTDLMQPGDTLALTFSEALAPGSVPDGRDVTESRSSSTGTLTIPGLITPASIDFGYLDTSGDSATSSTTSALTAETITVTLGTLTTNGSVAGGSGGASIFPAASLKDPAGNAAASEAPATARLVSPLF